MENLKTNLSKYHYLDSLIKQGFQKALSVPQKGLRKPKKPSNENILPFITTFNPNNPNIYSTIKSSFNCLKNNNVSGFHNIRPMQSKRQSPNLKKLLTKAKFAEVLSGTFNCSDKRYECCISWSMITTPLKKFKSLLNWKIASHAIVFTLYVGETGEGETKLRDRVRMYRKHIREPQYQQLKVEGHLRLCDKGEFGYFLSCKCVHKIQI